MTDAGEVRRWFVDRREGAWWVVLDQAGRVLELPEWVLPSGTQEGDVLEVEVAEVAEVAEEKGARRLILRRNRQATEEARREAAAALARLRQGDPGGDIDL